MIEIKTFKDFEAFDVINARNKTQVVLVNEKALGSYQVSVYDCMGELISEKRMALKKGVVAIDVPASELVKFKK